MRLEISTHEIAAAFEGAIIKKNGYTVATFLWCLN